MVATSFGGHLLRRIDREGGPPLIRRKVHRLLCWSRHDPALSPAQQTSGGTMLALDPDVVDAV